MSLPAELTADTTSPRQRRGYGLLLLIITSTLWSLSGVAVKTAEMHPLAFALWRSVSASIVLAALLPLGTGRTPWLSRWMILSVLLYTAVVALLVSAMTFATAATGILLQYTGPMFCALFAWIFQRRTVGWWTVTAMAIAGAGIMVMIAGGERQAGPIGAICGVLSGMCFGALILVLEKLNRVGDGPVNVIGAMFLNNFGSVILLLPLCYFAGALTADTRQLAITGVIGVIQLALPYVLFQIALKHVSPVEASLLILLEPVLNPIWVALATAERPDAATMIGGAAILVAMVVEALKPSRGASRLRGTRQNSS